MKIALNSYFTGLLDLLYPPLCISCNRRTFSVQHLFCLNCQAHIHPTDMVYHPSNPFTAKFSGRIPLKQGAALFYYIKGSRLQLALERLKYKNEPEIGFSLGEYLGLLMKGQDHFQDLDLIVPVPLHPRKEMQRGYNQSALIAQGIGKSISIPVEERALQRQLYTNSQVQKSRADRLENMQFAFKASTKINLKDKHILLVDDILTTGATLEACALQLLVVHDCKLSMATIGFSG